MTVRIGVVTFPGSLDDRDAQRAVRIAGALETAHRAGVLHRDIKPSNLLVTALGAPVLADFGIAGLLDAVPGADADEVVAMSIPWSSPEVLDERTLGRHPLTVNSPDHDRIVDLHFTHAPSLLERSISTIFGIQRASLRGEHCGVRCSLSFTFRSLAFCTLVTRRS